MTARLSDENFRRLVEIRVNQGFNAAQVVVGIPPETTPENANAASPFGPAWTWLGEFNYPYLKHARNRIMDMNRSGLTAIIYGAWGHQINWLGINRMIDWWQTIIEYTGDLDVFYCLTGESAHHLGLSDLLVSPQKLPWLFKIGESARNNKHARGLLYKLHQKSQARENRRLAWSKVLQQVAELTDKPIFIHPSPPDLGFQCVTNANHLSVNSAQTGHTYQTRNFLHQLPLAHAETKDPQKRGFVNLEPWYEGIFDQFIGPDQLYAYWVSMLAGAASYCYGAHGIWNVGDGKFLSHWGQQTFEQALKLDTPHLIGLSHRLLRPFFGKTAEVKVKEVNHQLVSIQRNYDGVSFTYHPEIYETEKYPRGRIWLPTEGRFSNHLPLRGQVVIISESQ